MMIRKWATVIGLLNFVLLFLACYHMQMRRLSNFEINNRPVKYIGHILPGVTADSKFMKDFFNFSSADLLMNLLIHSSIEFVCSSNLQINVSLALLKLKRPKHFPHVSVLQ